MESICAGSAFNCGFELALGAGIGLLAVIGIALMILFALSFTMGRVDDDEDDEDEESSPNLVATNDVAVLAIIDLIRVNVGKDEANWLAADMRATIGSSRIEAARKTLDRALRDLSDRAKGAL